MPTGVFLDVYHNSFPHRFHRFTDVRIVQYSANTVANKEMPHNNTVEHKIDLEIVYHEVGDTLGLQKIFSDPLRALTEPTPEIDLYIIVDPSRSQFSIPNHSILSKDLPRYPRFGPFIKTNVTQIAGTSTLVMQMTIEWTQRNLLESPISSFYCKASFSIDETGATTIRKTGSLEVVKEQYDPGEDKLPVPRLVGTWDTAGTSNTVPRPNLNPLAPAPQGDAWRNDVVSDKVPGNSAAETVTNYPDYYRMMVAGNMYPGFRRVSQEYAVDESGCRLLFDVVDKEFFGNLPAPARAGNCQFTFERSIDDKNQAIGIKHFIASVKGDKNVTAGALLTLCIRLSQNRIDFQNDLIVKTRVTQENMLTENAITFEIAAKATSAQTFTPAGGIFAPGGGTGSSTTGSTGSITGGAPLGNILRSIQTPQGVFQFVPALMPPEYGISGIIRVVTAAHSNASPAIVPPNFRERASTIQLTREDPGFNENAAGATYIFSNQVFDRFRDGDQLDPLDNDPRFRYRTWFIPEVPRGPNDGDGNIATSGDSGKDPDLSSAYASNAYSTSKIQTGLIEVPAVAFNARAKVFQCSAPRVNRVEMVEASAKNRAPKRLFDDLKANSIVGAMDVNVSSGTPDLNGNRILSSVMTREVTLVPPPDLPAEGVGASPSDPSWEVVNRTFEGETVRIVQYNPRSIPMPPSENQGIAPNYTPPSYTEGVTPQAYLA